MENVNNLNGVPNFGHGLPENGEVVAGVTDIPQMNMEDEVTDVPAEGHVDVPEEDEVPTEEVTE